MKKIVCPSCRVHYFVENVTLGYVKCLDCGCRYLQEQADESKTILDYILPNRIVKS